MDDQDALEGSGRGGSDNRDDLEASGSGLGPDDEDGDDDHGTTLDISIYKAIDSNRERYQCDDSFTREREV